MRVALVRVVLALLLALLAACSAPAQPPITNASPAPRGPAPLVERGGPYGLTTQHLPAITADGAQIVAAVREPDGERGLPNLTLVVKDRRDAQVDQHVVLSRAEADQVPDAALDDRIARANAWLAQRGFAGMPAADGYSVTWQASHLRIARGAEVLVDRDTPASWLPRTQVVADRTCVIEPQLASAVVADRLAVVTIRYLAREEFCFGDADQHHVIVW